MDSQERTPELNELTLDELVDVRGGYSWGEVILYSEKVAAFVRENKIAGMTLDECINQALAYMRNYIGRYISREQVIALVNRIYGAG